MRVLVYRDGRFLMVRQGGHWLPPGGTPEPGEQPQATARREFGEETGVEVELGPELGRVTSPRGRVTLVFAGRIAAEPRAAGLAGEGIDALAWLTADEADDYVRRLLSLWRE